MVASSCQLPTWAGLTLSGYLAACVGHISDEIRKVLGAATDMTY